MLYPDAQLRAARSARERLTLLAAPLENQREALARDVAAGLTQQPKSLPCRYFYDLEGSHLFEEICRLPEYYLTRAERQILLAHGRRAGVAVRPNVTVVELGSGSARRHRSCSRPSSSAADTSAT
jgi:L-histidine N-alpha-methyltransferase